MSAPFSIQLVQIISAPGNATFLFIFSRFGRFYVVLMHVLNLCVQKPENACGRNARSEFAASRYHCVWHRIETVLWCCRVLDVFICQIYLIFIIGKIHQGLTSDFVSPVCSWQHSFTGAPGRCARLSILLWPLDGFIVFLQPDAILAFTFVALIHVALGWKRFMNFTIC